MSKTAEILSDNDALYLMREAVDLDADTDNSGQLVIYTGVYRWDDDTLRRMPQNPEDRGQ